MNYDEHLTENRPWVAMALREHSKNFLIGKNIVYIKRFPSNKSSNYYPMIGLHFIYEKS